MRILPHPKAPLFLASDPKKILLEIIDTFISGHFVEGQFFPILVQAGYVSLWFFLKFIAGYAGPFDELNTGLNDSMCDFAMESHRPGDRSAAFTGRFCFKSTIFTIGDCVWTLLRDPDESCGLFSCTAERSGEFLETAQRVFDSNELFAALYPDYVPAKNAPRWNAKEAVLPNRSKYQTSASISAHGVGCSTAGIHANRIYIDDPVGDQQLNANRESSADMYRISNWLKSNLRTLVKSFKSSIMYVGTRYAVDDAHAFIFNSIRERIGYWKELDDRTYKFSSNGEWRVYYRMVVEDDKITMPERYTKAMIEAAKKEDPWTYWTQIQNHPQKSGLSELVHYDVNECELIYDGGGWWISYFDNDEFGNSVRTKVNLAECDTKQAIDPASTEKYISAKTSRTAVGVVAHHSSDKIFLLSLDVDFVPPSTIIDWLFANAKRFYGYLGGTLLEAQGAYKILGPVIKDEERRRAQAALSSKSKVYYLNLRPISKTGEKDAVIRNTLQPVLEKRNLYAEKSIRQKLLDEVTTFPASNRKDILDMLCLGINNTIRPLSEKEMYEKEKQDEAWSKRTANAAGY
jgi:hypothetical protein